MFRRATSLPSSPGQIAWRRLLRNPPAAGGLLIILLAAVVALLGYLLTPDNSPNCNRQFLELATRPPGFRVKVLKLRKNTEYRPVGFFRFLAHGKNSPYEFIPVNRVWFEEDGLVAELFNDMDSATVLTRSWSPADVVYPLDTGEPVITAGGNITFSLPDGERKTMSLAALQEAIMAGHLQEMRFVLGTDRFGRDLLSRLMLGTRISLSVGLISVFISLLIGTFIGAAGGYFRGWVDRLVLWLINVVWSIPTLLMVIAITLVLGKGFWQIFIAVGLTMWVEVARVVRGQVLGIREKEYVEAARAMGFSHFRILFRHILPNAFTPVIIISAANFASAILIEAGLSFLGIGVQPPVPSWGTMIKDHYGYIIMNQAYLAILPGLAIMLMVLSFTLLGNGLRDALDSRAVRTDSSEVSPVQDHA